MQITNNQSRSIIFMQPDGRTDAEYSPHGRHHRLHRVHTGTPGTTEVDYPTKTLLPDLAISI